MFTPPVVHPITLEARLQATTKPGRKMDVPQALVKVTLHQVALSLSKQQVEEKVLPLEYLVVYYSGDARTLKTL